MRAHGVKRIAAGTALRLNGGRIPLSSGATLHVDPSDLRAVDLRMRRGEADRHVIALWKRLVSELQPALAVDVGANYGEVGLSCRYPTGCRLHLIEANPAIAHHLRTSATTHPHSDIWVHEWAATDKDGVITLHVRNSYSGTASTRPGGGEPVEVAAYRIENQISGDGPLVFKVDVEGAEATALEGMAQLLKNGDFAGICEVEHADFSTMSYLHEQFEVSVVSLKDYRFHRSPDPHHTASAVAARPRKAMKDVLLLPLGTD